MTISDDLRTDLRRNRVLRGDGKQINVVGKMLEAGSFLPVPPSLQPYAFTAFDWQASAGGHPAAPTKEVSDR